MSTIVALGVWLLTLGLLATAIAFGLATRGIEAAPDQPPLLEQLGAFVPLVLAYASVGAVLAARRPRNTIGWLFAISALCGAAGLASLGYGIQMRGTPDSAAPYAVWIARQLFNAVFFPGMMLVLPLFPTGTLRSRLERTAAGLVLVSAAIAAATHGVVAANFGEAWPNPFAIAGLAQLYRPALTAGNIAFGLGLLASITSLVMRYRRGTLIERAQMRWLLYASLLTGATVVVALMVGQTSDPTLVGLGFVAFLVGLALIPVSIAIAILRYHLYDIDVLINRTLVYGAVTATLLGTYAAAVLLLQQLFRLFTLGNDLAVAASTLLIAALFQPVRRRIQDAVDHRFYRRKYDAEKTVAAFSAHLRQELDLDALGAELLDVVRKTMQPRSATLWLRRTRR